MEAINHIGVDFSSPLSYTLSFHYNGVIMTAMVSQMTSLMVVYSAIYSDQIKENIKA